MDRVHARADVLLGAEGVKACSPPFIFVPLMMKTIFSELLEQKDEYILPIINLPMTSLYNFLLPIWILKKCIRTGSHINQRRRGFMTIK
jgi:hypothetical protein